MGNFFVRISTVLVAVYFSISYCLAQFCGLDILKDFYLLFFELCVLVSMFESGKYHCKYMRWTMLGIFVCDLLSQLDYYYNIFSVNAHNLIPLSILGLSIIIPLTLAIRHFYQVNKLKNKRKSYAEYRIKRD